MFFNKIFLLSLFIALSYATNSYISFTHLEDLIVIGEEKLQSYTNDLDEEGTMEIVLKLDNGKEYNLKPTACHIEKGKFNWTPPTSIPDGSYGTFFYTVYLDNDEFTGESTSMKFVSSSHSSSDSSSSHSSSDSSSHSSSDSSDSSSSHSSSDSSTVNDEGENTNPNQLVSNEPLDNENAFNTINGNNTLSDTQETQNLTTNEQNITKPSLSESVNIQNNGSNAENLITQNKTMLMYIGGGGGVVFVAVAGLLLFNKAKSKKSLNDYELDQKPYNSNKNSMDISHNSNLLNGNLAPATLYGFPDYNDNNMNNNTFKTGQYNFSNTYSTSNTGSLHYTPPSINYNSINKNNGYFANNQQEDYTNRNTYEMISPYDPTDTSYQNYSYNFNDNLVLDNNGMINVNSNNPYTNVGVDVSMRRSLPNSENYSANPRNGSLPRNKVPENVKAPLMNYNSDEENRRNYRSSVLSYISSNRDTFYDAAKAEHSVSHILLNQICTIAYASQPENDDELYLCVGDKVKILEVYDDGWAYSLHISSGLEGMLPLNCTAEFYQ